MFKPTLSSLTQYFQITALLILSIFFKDRIQEFTARDNSKPPRKQFPD